ncbi:MAG: cyclic nucleotide-binding domain-containing protein, partial [Sulfitobacter sp.]
RAGMKRPDVLIFDQAFVGNELGEARERLRELMPETTQIFLSDEFDAPESYDLLVEVNHGRVDGVDSTERYESSSSVSEDLRRKLDILQRSELFAPLDSRAQRLLAFAAQWYDAPAGKVIFSADEPPDATYLCLSGKAELTFRDKSGDERRVSLVEPGRVIGDLAVIVREPRQANLRALEDSQFLRFGAEEFRSVIENDRTVLLSLLKTVAGHLSGAANMIRDAEIPIPRETFEDED